LTKIRNPARVLNKPKMIPAQSFMGGRRFDFKSVKDYFFIKMVAARWSG